MSIKTYLSVENRLHLDLSCEVKFFGTGLGTLVPFLENLAEPGCIDLDKLLQ